MPELVPETSPEAEPEPSAEAMEVTAEEMLSAYEVDGEAADARFADKILKVMGVIATIDVKDKMDTHFIRLTGAKKEHLDTVRCMFDKKHADALKQLTVGATVTVQGKYDGSLIDIRMKDCVLVD